jgi:virginiamycin B lyase
MIARFRDAAALASQHSRPRVSRTQLLPCIATSPFGTMWFAESGVDRMTASRLKVVEMTQRATIFIALAFLTVFVTACSGSPSSVPPLRTGVQGMTSLLRPGIDRVRIREFADLPQYGSGYYSPSSITSGPGGLLWVTDTIDQDFGENVVVALAPSGAQQHTFYYGGRTSQGSSFQDIVEGPDGALWITDAYNEQILKMTPEGSYTGFPLHNYSAPLGICSGPDKALWFAEDSSPPEIGRITTSGRIKLFTIPSLANDIAAGPDGALWFTQPAGDQIGRITKRGKVREYSNGISSGAEPYSIAAGPDGALWFTERAGGRIGRITTSGKVTEYSTGITPTEEPFDLTAGPDGAMWFTEYEKYGSYQVQDSKIGRITMRGTISEHSRGVNPKAAPTAITAGPDGRIWFVESRADETGRARL